jgi:hypothetical protein
MTQAKRPISRSSTPIDFAPLILDLEAEVREEPEKKRGDAKLFVTLIGIAIVLGAIGYFGFRENKIEGAAKVVQTKTRTSTSGIMPGTIVSPNEKKGVLTHGIKNAKLVLENVDGQDVMKVSIPDKAPEGITWVYEWTKNNEPFGKGDSVRGFKRGDSIALKIIPYDGENYGAAKVLAVEIKNTVPRIMEGQSATFDGNKLTYQLKAIDADGDTLTYSLVEGPPGVTVEQKSGVISWLNVPEDQQKLELKVKINDGHNGEIIYPATVNFSQAVKEKLTAQK